MHHLVHQLSAAITALGITEYTQGHFSSSSSPWDFTEIGVGVGARAGAVAFAPSAAAADITPPVRAVVRFGLIRAQDPFSAVLPKRTNRTKTGIKTRIKQLTRF